jgi:hypothetical protein
VYVDEDQWDAAFKAARLELEALECAGLLLPQTPESRRIIATRVAAAAVRAASAPAGDVADLPGVHIDEIGSHTATATDRADVRGRRSGDGGW